MFFSLFSLLDYADLLESWQGTVGCHENTKSWNETLSFISLHDWMTALGSAHFTTFIDFLKSSKFSFVNI